MSTKSIRESLADNIQEVLLYLGVVSTISKRRIVKNDNKSCWELLFSGKMTGYIHVYNNDFIVLNVPEAKVLFHSYEKFREFVIVNYGRIK